MIICKLVGQLQHLQSHRPHAVMARAVTGRVVKDDQRWLVWNTQLEPHLKHVCQDLVKQAFEGVVVLQFVKWNEQELRTMN